MERKNAFNGSRYAMPLVLGIGLVLSGNGCAHQADTGRKDSGQAEAQDRSGEGTVVQEIEDLRSNADVRISEEDSASQWTRDEVGEALYEEDARESADGGETESEGDGGRALPRTRSSASRVWCVPPGVFLYGPVPVEVDLDGYCIDVVEVTAGRSACVDAGGCEGSNLDLVPEPGGRNLSQSMHLGPGGLPSKFPELVSSGGILPVGREAAANQ